MFTDTTPLPICSSPLPQATWKNYLINLHHAPIVVSRSPSPRVGRLLSPFALHCVAQTIGFATKGTCAAGISASDAFATQQCDAQTEFTCSDGECIPADSHKDSIRDCEDGSDEPPPPPPPVRQQSAPIATARPCI